MKKKNFVTLLMSVVGALVLIVMFLIRRKMDGKPMIKFSGRAVGIALLGLLGTVVFGAGMCMVLVCDMMLLGILVGVVGIILLICLIPICKGVE